MRFLKSLSKFLIITFGSISLIAIMGAGAAGIYYKKDALEYYSNIRNETQKEDTGNIFTNIRTIMDNLKNNVSSSKGQIQNLITTAETEINNLTNKITELENAINNGTYVAKASTNQAQENIKQLIESLKQVKNQLQTSINNVKNNIEGENGVITTIDNFFKQDGPADKINGYVTQGENIFNSISNIFAQTPPDKFENYYSTITISMTAIPAIILGFGLIGSIAGVVCYKKVDGKLVRRSREKQDLANHIKKIVKKHPDILNQIK